MAAAERAPSWRNEVRIGGLTEPFSPKDYLGDAKVPLLLVVAPADKLIPPGSGIAVASAAPNTRSSRSPAATSMRTGRLFAASSERAIQWFRRHLTS